MKLRYIIFLRFSVISSLLGTNTIDICFIIISSEIGMFIYIHTYTSKNYVPGILMDSVSDAHCIT
jgi:hypothetical protein